MDNVVALKKDKAKELLDSLLSDAGPDAKVLVVMLSKSKAVHFGWAGANSAEAAWMLKVMELNVNRLIESNRE